MANKLLWVVLCCFLGNFSVIVVAEEGEQEVKFVEFIVTYKDNCTNTRQKSPKGSHSVMTTEELTGFLSDINTKVNGISVPTINPEAIKGLTKIDIPAEYCVDYIEPNYEAFNEKVIIANQSSNERRLRNQEDFWYLDTIHASEAHQIINPKNDVIVAVIDTGIDVQHPDLKNHLWEKDGVYGYNMFDYSGNIADIKAKSVYESAKGYEYHGTHVSGIVAKTANTPNVKIMVVKVYKRLEDGSVTGGNVDKIIKAIDYAINNGAKIINLSLYIRKTQGAPKALYDRILQARKADVLFVVSAGNRACNLDSLGQVCVQYPAFYNLDNVITVAGVNEVEELWLDPPNELGIPIGSNYGSLSVDIAAPGEAIYSTYKNEGYERLNGTSMAAPQVAAVAALLWAEKPDLNYREVKKIILDSADKVDNLAVEGNRRLNAYEAIKSLQESPSISLPNTEAICEHFIEGDNLLLDCSGSYSINQNINSCQWDIFEEGSLTKLHSSIDKTLSLDINEFAFKDTVYEAKLSVNTSDESESSETSCRFKLEKGIPQEHCNTIFDILDNQKTPIGIDVDITKCFSQVNAPTIPACFWGLNGAEATGNSCEISEQIDTIGHHSLYKKMGGNEQEQSIFVFPTLDSETELKGMKFGGGVSLNQSKLYEIQDSIGSPSKLTDIDVRGVLIPYKEHKGLPADIVAYAKLTTQEEGNIVEILYSFSLLPDDRIDVQLWNGADEQLPTFKQVPGLKNKEPLTIYNYAGEAGALENFEGILEFGFGYRLSNDLTRKVYRNKKNIKVNIGNVVY